MKRKEWNSWKTRRHLQYSRLFRQIYCPFYDAVPKCEEHRFSLGEGGTPATRDLTPSWAPGDNSTVKFRRDVENLIASLRGLPGDFSRSREDRAVGLGSLVSVLEERHALQRESPEHVIMAHWREILGPHADRCRPERVDKAGRLVIQVSSAVLKQELAFQERTILRKIAQLSGCEGIRGLLFRAG